MKEETKNKFAAILAAAQKQAKPEVKQIAKAEEVKKEFHSIASDELSTLTFDDLIEPEEIKLKVVDYSERAFAIIGDTKPIKDKLKKLGGKFNFRLNCGAGWIFPKTKAYTVRKALNLI
jgi:hypothetical protein